MQDTCTLGDYIQNRNSDRCRVLALIAIIDQMYINLLNAATGQNNLIQEYWMDDGQMRVKTQYRSIEDMEKGINALERQLQMYRNRLSGRGVALRNARNLFPHRHGHNC